MRGRDNGKTIRVVTPDDRYFVSRNGKTVNWSFYDQDIFLFTKGIVAIAVLAWPHSLPERGLHIIDT